MLPLLLFAVCQQSMSNINVSPDRSRRNLACYPLFFSFFVVLFREGRGQQASRKT